MHVEGKVGNCREGRKEKRERCKGVGKENKGKGGMGRERKGKEVKRGKPRLGFGHGPRVPGYATESRLRAWGRLWSNEVASDTEQRNSQCYGQAVVRP